MAGLKVIAAVTTEPVTLAEARLQLHLTADDSTAEDALLSAWITAAREVAEQYTGRALAPQTLELALDYFPAYSIVLDQGPVSSVTSIKYTDSDGVEQTISASNYALSPYGLADTVTPAYDFTWPTARSIPDAVRIRYLAGYGATVAEAIPYPQQKSVKAALQLMVAWMNEHRGDAMDPSDIQPPAAKALLNTVLVRGYS